MFTINIRFIDHNDNDHQGKLATELEGDVQGAQMAAKPFNLHAQIPAVRWLPHIFIYFGDTWKHCTALQTL